MTVPHFGLSGKHPPTRSASSLGLKFFLSFNAATGILSGTPVAGTTGIYPLTFAAHNGVGSDATQSFTLTVIQAAPVITSANGATFIIGMLGSFTVTATGSPTPTLSESGALPSGISFNASNGVLSGTPAAGAAGTYPITFTASNGVGSNATQNFTLAVSAQGGNVYYYFDDALGSSRVITNSNGAICYDSDFYPFGGERAYTSTCIQNYKFTGKERDSESGLDNFGARYDSSQYGRFMTPDPLWIKADRMLDPQRLNLYAYGRNNPLKFTDPTGIDVTIGNCPEDHTVSQCFAAVQQGLRKEDRSHIQLVEGNGQNGFKKGEYGITADKDYKSTSGNFQTLQYAANDHSVKAVTYFETTGFQLQASVGVNVGGKVQLESLTKAAGMPITMGQGLGGYTFYQRWGAPQAGVVYSLKPETQMINLGDTALDMTVNFYHELQHVVLGDFGRSALAGQHDAPGVNAATQDAEREAIQNAAQH